MTGIVPIVFVPFDERGDLHSGDLERVVRFELTGGADGIGIGGFASEAYKLTDAERLRAAQVVAHTVGGAVPLVVGINAGSTEAAIQQMRAHKPLEPSVYMVLPPATFSYSATSLVAHYAALAGASDVPIMVQHSPHVPQYGHVNLEVEQLAEIAHASSQIAYFKIEGGGAPARMRALKPLLPDGVKLFGGVGGISFLDELEVGVAGVIPGVGFNEVFKDAWAAWGRGDTLEVRAILERSQALVQAVSGKGHEFSLHARKHLALRARLIGSATVRRPTEAPTQAEIDAVFAAADAHTLRISRTPGSSTIP